MKILIVVAMESELSGFLSKLDTEVMLVNGFKVYKSNINDKIVYLAKSDVGKVNSAVLTTSLILKLKPNFVINAGIGGGLNKRLNLLDVVASSSVAYHDFDLTAFGYSKGQMDDNVTYFKGSRKLLSLVNDNVIKGIIVSGDQFVSGIEAMSVINKNFPKALVCDMEGCSIAHAATLLGRKFLVIRCISDNVFLENHVGVYQDYKPLAIEKVANETISLINKL